MKSSRPANPSPEPPIDESAAEALRTLGFNEADGWLDHVRKAETLDPLGAIDGYRILDVCGRGGQSIVYRAQHDGGRIVAIKRIHGGAQASSSARQRLSFELRAAAVLEHPAIVKATPVPVDGEVLVEMDWIDGVPLTTWARGGDDGPPPTTAVILDVFGTICDAIAHAHERGIVHRDLKPSNILVDRQDRPHVLDFGLAKTLGDLDVARTRLTVTEQVLGTPAYASPEQVGGISDIDERSDVYSLGVILYEVFAGTSPYASPVSLGRLLAEVERGAPRRPRMIDASVPRSVEAVILKAMGRTPEQRYSSMTDMRADLLRCRSGENVAAPAPGFVYDLRAFGRRHPLRSVLMVAAIAMLALTAIIITANAVRLQRAHDETLRAHQAAERVSDFLTRLALGAEVGSRRPAILARLDEVARELDTEFDDDPWARARGAVAFGRIFARVDAWDRVDPLLSSAIETYRDIGPADRMEVAESLRLLALARAHVGGSDAETLAREAVAMVVRLEGAASTRQVNFLATLGEVLLIQRGPDGVDAADACFDRAITLLGGDEPLHPAWAATIRTTHARGLAYAGEQRRAAAELEKALDLFARAGVGPLDRNLRECRAVLLSLRPETEE